MEIWDENDWLKNKNLVEISAIEEHSLNIIEIYDILIGWCRWCEIIMIGVNLGQS